jgi:hypothetical protein
MPGRGNGVVPPAPGRSRSGYGADTGVGGHSARYERLPGFDDLGVAADSGPDFGAGSHTPAPGAAAPRSAPGGSARAAAPAPRPPIAKGSLKEARFGRGQRVKHLDYGAGTVIASSVVGSEELVLVRFDSRPDKPKNLSLSIHRLEPA